jgi:hypothetical protein
VQKVITKLFQEPALASISNRAVSKIEFCMKLTACVVVSDPPGNVDQRANRAARGLELYVEGTKICVALCLWSNILKELDNQMIMILAIYQQRVWPKTAGPDKNVRPCLICSV